ncbi:hypothetical protein Pmani_030481 [Petrolisthes manimaculis]|uniref:Uncharacterized protein n=1 Tax=Petrolisthes manimaculis TaxID=1843537 RepID=A0AAE1NXS0_9EUCA|nr:hypothetical protein Pmani_030481 [Petrolisthes manimaculis]
MMATLLHNNDAMERSLDTPHTPPPCPHKPSHPSFQSRVVEYKRLITTIIVCCSSINNNNNNNNSTIYNCV